MTAAAQPRRKRPAGPRAGSVCWLLLAVLGVPPGLVYVGVATSTALGMTLVCLGLIVSTRLPRRLPHWASPATPARALWFALPLVTLIAIHLVLSVRHGPVDVVRGLLSLIPLTLLIAAGTALAIRLTSAPDTAVHTGAVTAFAVLCGSALVGATGWGPPTLVAEPWRRPVFPFFEPSAFALAFTPMLLYALVTTRGRHRVAALAAALVCPALITNLTLMCGLALVALVTLRKRLLVTVALLVALLVSQLDLTYIAERVDLSGESSNLSNLVYIQGWQMIGEAWDRSGGAGIGMQQLGVFGTEVPASDVLRALREGEDMNLLDGSFAFAKLGADFGVFGFAVAAVLSILAVRSAIILRAVSTRDRAHGLPPALVLAHCSVASFPIELFIRSAGYFTGAAMLLSGALWLLHAHRAARLAAGSRSAMPAGPVH